MSQPLCLIPYYIIAVYIFFFDKQVRCWNKVSFERNLIDLPFLSLEYSQQSLSASSTIDLGSPNKY